MYWNQSQSSSGPLFCQIAPLILAGDLFPHLWNVTENINVSQLYCEDNFMHDGDTSREVLSPEMTD